MRVNVDLDRCQGHGLCVYAAPDVFDLDDEGQVHYDPSPAPEQRDNVQDAVRSCPTAAISLDLQASEADATTTTEGSRR